MNPTLQGGAPSSYGAAPAAANTMGMQRSPHQFMELLDHLRTEYENLAAENKNYRGLREEYQRKVEEQVCQTLLPPHLLMGCKPHLYIVIATFSSLVKCTILCSLSWFFVLGFAFDLYYVCAERPCR